MVGTSGTAPPVCSPRSGWVGLSSFMEVATVPQRVRCPESTFVPASVPAVIALIGPVTEESVFYQDGKCWLESEHDGEDHRSLITDGNAGKDIWISWSDGHLPQIIMELGPCTAREEEGMDSCALFDRHPGGHIWEFRDPEHEAVAQYLKANPDEVRAMLPDSLAGKAVLWPMN